MKENNAILEKIVQFSLDVIKLHIVHLQNKEYVLSKQFLRSGTSFGAMSEEAQGPHSKKDFSAKFEIAFKEARETLYWCRLLNECQRVKLDYANYIHQIKEILRILNRLLIP